MLFVQKCRNLVCVGGIFPYHSENFPHAENLKPFFCSTAFVDKIIKVIKVTSFYQIVVNIGKYLPQKGKARHSLFSWTFPFFGKYFPILTTS